MVAQARIVFLNNRNHLTDSTGHDCRYRTADGQPLLPGYWYRVSWPDDVEEPLFDANAHYAGPYDSEDEAKNALARVPNPMRPASMPPLGDSQASPLAGTPYFPDWHCGR